MLIQRYGVRCGAKMANTASFYLCKINLQFAF